MKNINKLIAGLAALALANLAAYSCASAWTTAAGNASLPISATAALPDQTAVDQARAGAHPDGLPWLEIRGFGMQYSPSRIAAYALAYSGDKIQNVDVVPDPIKFQACLKWLVENLSESSPSVWGWKYNFDNTYNDVTTTAPWISAFGQAIGIQALLRGWQKFKQDSYLESAIKAASGFFIPIANGGLLFEDKENIWFEEIPDPRNNPPHILNGHMRALLALRELHIATSDSLYDKWFQKGLKTLENWLPLYDNGYALRYDLNPQKKELLFKIANPYGFSSYPLAISSISLRDPVSQKKVMITLGDDGDADGGTRIAGIHWSQPEQVGGRNARRIESVEGGKEQHSYFYLTLPDEWKDNLRDVAFELYITYYDEAPGNLAIQKKSIVPGKEFISLNDGDLLLSGAGQWRTWMIPVNTTDLGFWVGCEYAAYHSRYLASLAQYSSSIAQWSYIAKGYANMQAPDWQDLTVVTPDMAEIPPQTLLKDYFAKGEDGVIRQFIGKPEGDIMIDSPFCVAKQVTDPDFSYAGKNGIRLYPEPAKALNWLLRSDTYKIIDDAAVHQYTFDTAYNDVVTKAPWGSAFGQAFVLSALMQAAEKMPRQEDSLSLLKKVSAAYELPIAHGGLTFFDRAGLPFFEEVPNNTHILIGHTASIVSLFKADQVLLKKGDHQRLVRRGLLGLKKYLHRFDTGYWLKYDQNPPKQLFFQIVWRGGDTSVPLAELRLENPQSQTATRVRLDALFGEIEEASRISGNGWKQSYVDTGAVRQCTTTVTAENYDSPLCFAFLNLPEQSCEDWFDLPVHRLAIRYKDTQAGALNIKIRSIHEGNITSFVPLRDGLIITKGDNHWKTAFIAVNPQEMGWFKGVDYQQFEIKDLFDIAALTNELFFMQFAERQNYYLESKLKEQPLIFEELTIINPHAPPLSAEQEKPFLQGNDERNPLRYYNIPISMAVRKLAHDATKDIASDHEKILRLMELVKKFRIGQADDQSLDGLLKTGVGSCGNFAHLLLGFSASLGMPGHHVYLLNYPPNSGHTVAEIFADGAWRLYDPTFGAYYINNNMPEKGALSYDEIRSGYESDAPVECIAAMPRMGLDQFAGKNIFLKARPQGPGGSDQPFLFPLRLNPGKSPAYYSQQFQGADILGAASLNANHEWMLEDLTPGQEYVFALTPSGLHDEESLAENVFASFALEVALEGTTDDRRFVHTFDRGAADTELPKELAIRFTPLWPQVVITLTHPYRGPKKRYLIMEQYSLTRVQ